MSDADPTSPSDGCVTLKWSAVSGLSGRIDVPPLGPADREQLPMVEGGRDATPDEVPPQQQTKPKLPGTFNPKADNPHSDWTPGWSGQLYST